MKIISVIKKSFKEQIRSYWIFILTVTMAPAFIFIYFLILESEKPEFELLILNHDKGIEQLGLKLNYADLIIEELSKVKTDSIGIPLNLSVIIEKELLRIKKV